MNDQLKEYRNHLVETLQKVSESYDKTIITLSGGALGISFTFIKDYLGNNEAISPMLLFSGWVFLTISLASVVFSLFFGTLAFRKAIKQVDDGSIYENNAGGGLGKVTIYLHSSGAFSLIIGLLFVGTFVCHNIGERNNGRKAETSTNATQTATTKKASGFTRKENSSGSPSASTTSKP